MTLDYRQDNTQKALYIDRKIHRQDITYIGHYIDRTLHRYDIIQIERYKDRTLHRYVGHYVQGGPTKKQRLIFQPFYSFKKNRKWAPLPVHSFKFQKGGRLKLFFLSFDPVVGV